MKTINFYVWTLFIALASFTFTSCSGDDDVEPTPTPTPGPDVPTPDPDPEPKPELTTHFDIWVSLGSNSGMNSDNTQLVQSVDSLTEQEPINFKNSGADITALMYQEAIIKGKYYYQVPKSKDRIGKYQIVNDEVVTIAEFPFTGNTLKDRRYTHAWIDDKTLVLIGSNGDSNKILWIKVDTETMTNLAEGELDLPEPPKGDKFNTSGIAAYRDGQILYSFIYSKTTTHFYTAFINANDMTTESVVKEDRAEMMAGTAYGELLQNKTFFTPKGDYYIACNSVLAGATSTTQQYGTLLRIKKGENNFDASYKGYNYPNGKLVTVDCLSNDKALLYIQDPDHTGAPAWGNDYNCYYAILDLNTDAIEEIKYNGTVLPYSTGTFSQRSVVLDGKAYIGVNPKNEQPCVYIYDIETGDVTKGLTITTGYEFDRITIMDNK
ncbi:MAG: hypothetical protein LBL58_03625 [Tannerellaceae bacterium]|jgi:hypothetical protein|nr:hypothetical protein [Tannerellaceae bacterium]